MSGAGSDLGANCATFARWGVPEKSGMSSAVWENRLSGLGFMSAFLPERIGRPIFFDSHGFGFRLECFGILTVFVFGVS